MILNFNYYRDMLGRDMRARTADGRYTQRDLIRCIKGACDRHSPTGNGKPLYEQIIPSFSKEGIIDTYNELGRDGWFEMITDMILKEIEEQSK